MDTARYLASTQSREPRRGRCGFGRINFATLSTGDPPLPGPKPHKALLRRQQRLSRSLNRKETGSANRRKARAKLARLHARIRNIRQDAQHKLTTDLTRRFHTIGIEDLNVKAMMGNRRLARSIADMGFHEFRRQLEYKAAMRGAMVVVADRWFAQQQDPALTADTRGTACPCRCVRGSARNAAGTMIGTGMPRST